MHKSESNFQSNPKPLKEEYEDLLEEEEYDNNSKEDEEE